MKRVDDKWIVKGGSVFCETQHRVQTEYGIKYLRRDSIAFNVGKEIAEHIVRLHNKELEKRNGT